MSYCYTKVSASASGSTFWMSRNFIKSWNFNLFAFFLAFQGSWYRTETDHEDSSVHKWKSFMITTYSPTVFAFYTHTKQTRYITTPPPPPKKKKNKNKNKNKNQMHLRMHNNDFGFLEWQLFVFWSKLLAFLMRNYFPKRTSGAPLHTLSKLYDVPVGFVFPSSFEAVN